MKTALLLAVWIAPMCALAPSFQDDPAKNLKSKEVSLRLSALERLSKDKNPKNEKLVQSVLGDDDWEVVEKAAEVLGRIGTSSSFDELVKLAIDGPLARIRTEAARSLAEIDAVGGSAALSKKATGKEAGRVLEALAALTEHKAAKYELKSIERLVESSKDDRTRAAAARTIVAANSVDKDDLFVRLATSAHPEVACAALDAVLEHPAVPRCAPTVQVLTRATLPDLVERRAEAVLAASIASAATEEERTKLADTHVAALIAAKEGAVCARGVRVAIDLARSSAGGGGSAGPDGSGRAAGSDNAAVPATRLLALIRPALAHASPVARAQAAAALEPIGGDGAAAEAARLAANDKDERVRRAAMLAMSRLKGASEPATAAVLIERLATDVSPEVRLTAAVELGLPGNPTGRAALENALGDKEWSVATCAAVSLGKTHAPECVAPLAKLSKSATDWKLRGAAVEGLAQSYQKEALPALIEALADADATVVRSAHLFLCSVAKELLPAKVEPWREWWAKNGPKVELVEPPKITTGSRKRGDTQAPVIATDLEVWRDLDIVVLDSRGDHIQKVLDEQKVKHRMTMAGKLGADGLHPGAIFVANCTGEIETADVERVRWFVLCGGHLFGSCWALHETIERALPGVVRKAETASEVVDHVPAHDCSQGSPYVAGVFRTGVVPVYALEGAHLIEVVAPERCEVLLDSPEALAHWGAGNLAVLFEEGHGTVVDSVNHFEAQGFESVDGLKTAQDRQAWAVDHMGLAYEDLRKVRGEKWWDNSVRASEHVTDLSVFRLVTNIVRLRRAEGGL